MRHHCHIELGTADSGDVLAGVNQTGFAGPAQFAQGSVAVQSADRGSAALAGVKVGISGICSQTDLDVGTFLVAKHPVVVDVTFLAADNCPC